jgi:nitrate/TMAO reductase-like tetraheme cytochrome c subunit/mono/diheme cytochrome c family protein
LIVLIGGAKAWEYTNSPNFCGTTCHTMPPEFSAYQSSPHARVDCVNCHIGKGFITTQITRKAGDIRHVLATLFISYEYPIHIKQMRPVQETCESCHFPEKFSDDSFREIKGFNPDKNNTPYSIYLNLKTGGGSERIGLGRGIHWHIEQQVYYLPLDRDEQQIPYVKVVGEDGKITEYKAVDSKLVAGQINQASLKKVDCITCHNRITHLVDTPEKTINQLLALDQISTTIPEIRKKAVEVYSEPYPSTEMAMKGIEGLKDYYQKNYSEFYSANTDKISKAIAILQDAYRKGVYPEQKSDWNTHPNNVGHKDFPGCFRCHDGKHLDANLQAIRLECNLCHAIPKVAGPDDFVVRIEISRGPEPESHLNSNWIGLHRDAFNETCLNCHTTQNPGGVDNTSFCSNSACHGTVWKFAGYNAPGLREELKKLLPPTPTPTPAAAESKEQLTWEAKIGPMLGSKCTGCHGEGGIKGLNLTTYQTALKGGEDGAVIVPGDPENSMIVKKQSGTEPHFGQLDPDELKLLIQWITAGAPEK